MTKKHFTALAEALASMRPPNINNPQNGYDEAWREQWYQDRNVIANVCARFNPNFDRDRFVAATEA